VAFVLWAWAAAKIAKGLEGQHELVQERADDSWNLVRPTWFRGVKCLLAASVDLMYQRWPPSRRMVFAADVWEVRA
jgi:hypothetical protein